MAAKGVHPFARCDHVIMCHDKAFGKWCCRHVMQTPVQLMLRYEREYQGQIPKSVLHRLTRKSKDAWCSQGRKHTIAGGMLWVDCTQTCPDMFGQQFVRSWFLQSVAFMAGYLPTDKIWEVCQLHCPNSGFPYHTYHQDVTSAAISRNNSTQNLATICHRNEGNQMKLGSIKSRVAGGVEMMKYGKIACMFLFWFDREHLKPLSQHFCRWDAKILAVKMKMRFVDLKIYRIRSFHFVLL